MKTGRWMLGLAAAVGLLVGCADLSGGEVDLPTDEIQINPPQTAPPSLMQVTTMPRAEVVPPEDNGMLLRIPYRGSLNVTLEPVQEHLDGDFTLEVWLWFEHDGNQSVLDADTGLRISLDNGVIYAEVGGERLTGPAIVSHEWYHVAVVATENEARLYVNGGFQDREFPPPGWERPSGKLVLGFRPENLRSFIGQADNLRLVASQLYTEQMFMPTNRLAPVDNTLFGFSFNEEAPGGKVIDTSGIGVPGQLEGPAGLISGHI